jgi:hypothetical protein
MFRIVVYIILFYLGFQFIFKFLVPVYRATRQVRRGIRAMQDGINKPPPGPAPRSNPQGSASQHSTSETGEYIDFEEIK